MSTVDTRGFALAVILFTLVVVEVLVAGAFLVGLHEHHLGRNTKAHLRARAAADEGIGLQVVTWDTTALGNLGLGSSTVFDGAASNDASYTGTITRLGARLFLVLAEGAVSGSDVRVERALLVTLDSIGAAPLRGRAYFDPQ